MTREQIVQNVDNRLDELLACTGTYETLERAMQYSIRAGGKRLRPMLHVMACDLLGGNTRECLDTACAIEMIHTYSLIHDDLPAMDNDDLRRGRPTNHVVFGEAMAILAGDALLSYAYDTMIRNALNYSTHLEQHLCAIQEISRGCGTYGMLAGQAADVELEGRTLTDQQVQYIHARKTGALISAAVVSGAMLADASDEEITALRAYSEELGLAFQITDDVLDVEGNVNILGKTPGKDQTAGKCTFVTLHGVDGARRLAEDCIARAEDSLASFDEKRAQPLMHIAAQVARRER